MNHDVVIDVVKAMGDTCDRAQRGVGEMGPFLEQQLIAVSYTHLTLPTSDLV